MRRHAASLLVIFFMGLIHQAPAFAAAFAANDNILYRREAGPGGERVPRVAPDVAVAPAPTLPSLTSTPDEAALWALLRQQRYHELSTALARARQRFPEWQAPARLLDLARAGERRQRLDALVKAEDEAGLLAAYRTEPEIMNCDHLPAARLTVRALAKAQPAQAEGLVRQLLTCPDEQARFATLESLRDTFPEDVLLPMVADELGRNVSQRQPLRRLQYEIRRQPLLTANARRDSAEVARRLAMLAADIIEYRDTGTALVGAWSALNTGDRASADRWFRQALAWAPDRHEARVGAALCALGDDRYDEAFDLARQLPATQAERTSLLRDALVGKAQMAYTQRRYADVASLLREARQHGALPRYARLMEGWSLLHRNEFTLAAEKFSALYLEAPDQESAEGTLNALTSLGREDELDRLAQSEPLNSLRKRQRATQAFADKRFLAARELDPSLHPAAGGIGIPRLTLLSGYRDKEGTRGTSRLSIDWRPALEAAWGDARSGDWRVRLDRILLDSGGDFLPSRGFLSGKSHAVDGWQSAIAWRSDENAAWDAELGTTPSGGVIAPTWLGSLARNWSTSDDYTRLELHRQPVRESLLSYTGMREPDGSPDQAGQRWGRVMRNGLLFLHRADLTAGWNAFFQAQIEHFDGYHVEDNRRVAWDVGVGYALPLSAFDYAVVSLAGSRDRYRDNLSQFTPGHGGYFSPQRYWRIGPSLDFMTRENQSFMLRGRMAIGRTGKQESATPLFPLADDGRRYAGSTDTGSAREAELGGVWQLSDRLQAGGWLSYRNSPQYRDRAAIFFIRFLFEPRRSVLSSDLLRSPSSQLF